MEDNQRRRTKKHNFSKFLKIEGNYKMSNDSLGVFCEYIPERLASKVEESLKLKEDSKEFEAPKDEESKRYSYYETRTANDESLISTQSDSLEITVHVDIKPIKTFKIMLIGDRQSGKTTLAQKLTNASFRPSYTYHATQR